MGACGWSVDTCGCGTCWDNYPPAVQARAAALAIHVMWTATGRRYGPCEMTVLPCNPIPAGPLYRSFPVTDPFGYGLDGGSNFVPVLAAGEWSNRACGSGCRCTARCEVELPPPVHTITEVTVDGLIVPASAYQVHDNRLLVRTDGDCWPTCQVYGTEIPGFTVTYTRGEPIPDPVQAAAEVLACEYAKACSGGACKLPQRLASLSRQGVDVTVLDVPSEGGRIRTGITFVDDIISADNPYGLASAAGVFSPDLPDPRVVTFQGGS